MIKVLVVVKTLEVNGVSNVIMTYSRNINRELIEMGFATSEHIAESFKSEINNNGDKLFVINNRDSNPIKYIYKLASIVRRNKYDIVHVHGNSALITMELLAAMLGGAKVRIAHSHNTTCNHLKLDKMLRPLFNLCYTKGIACGRAAGEWMFRKRKFTTIHNGIDLGDFTFSEKSRDEIRSQLGLQGKMVIGHVGAFNYQKNHEFLIELFQRHLNIKKDSTLLLVGDGQLREEMEDKVRKKGIEDKVVFFGISNDVKSLMMAMDVFVLPSRFEGLPCVLVEAQALGLSCIVSDAVSQEAALTDNIAFLPLTADLDEWCDRIINFKISDRQVGSQIAHAQLADKGYDIEISTKALEAIYSNTTKKVEWGAQ
ncbi:glycosyltransferase family 1 protein [Paenibacillus glycanilyticus]|uniref:glycosyltransferase family 1 protein n=1 Tax=Paenibacillus glycanilyticus TaxID=126569 RepID=UPI000FDB24D6|nr:glycosyltransferase family 1 protein [Paenibacillus glycanilyticus]